MTHPDFMRRCFFTKQELVSNLMAPTTRWAKTHDCYRVSTTVTGLFVHANVASNKQRFSAFQRIAA
jgi:hypothetical protein